MGAGEISGTKSANGRENSGMGDYNAAAAAALSMNMFSVYSSLF